MAKKKKKPIRTVARNTGSGIISVREIIKRRLVSLGKSRHWLATETGMRPATVYDYLAGKTDVMSDKAERMLGALGMEIGPKR